MRGLSSIIDRRRTRARVLFGVSLATCAACAPLLELPKADESDAGAPQISSSTQGDATLTRVDATDDARWVYFDCDTGAEVSPEDPTNSDAWDLAFQRFRVISNGGVSGTGGVIVAPLPGAAFDDIDEAPTDGWVNDRLDSDDDDDTDRDSAFLGEATWYDYDDGGHTLSPNDVVYVVRATGGAYYKLRFVGYYDDAGTAGYPTFSWARVAAPAKGLSQEAFELIASSDPVIDPDSDRPQVVVNYPPEVVLVDASSSDVWVRVDVERGVVDADADSLEWDLAFLRTGIQTNGGDSGPGLGGMRAAPDDLNYDELDASPTYGFSSDAVAGKDSDGTPVSINPTSDDWYLYDLGTHIVTPKEQSHYVRRANGDYAKLQVLGYVDGIWGLLLDPLPRSTAPQITSLNVAELAAIKAGLGLEPWIYFSFRQGEVVDVRFGSSSDAWDIGIRGPWLRTNGGASGPGSGGASIANVSAIDEVGTFPSGGYSEDESEGSADATFGVSRVLSDAVELSSATADAGVAVDAASAPDAAAPSTEQILGIDDQSVFLVRTADGGYAALLFESYDGSTLRFAWAYAGYGQTDLN